MGSNTTPDSDVFMLIVCEKMGWTYAQFNEQPEWFIDKLLIKWAVENETRTKE